MWPHRPWLRSATTRAAPQGPLAGRGQDRQHLALSVTRGANLPTTSTSSRPSPRLLPLPRPGGVPTWAEAGLAQRSCHSDARWWRSEVGARGQPAPRWVRHPTHVRNEEEGGNAWRAEQRECRAGRSHLPRVQKRNGKVTTSAGLGTKPVRGEGLRGLQRNPQFKESEMINVGPSCLRPAVRNPESRCGPRS